MAGVKGNRRILYTKKVIKESLIELLQTKEIHQITVTDICIKADINRGTFYTHYKDAFDLLQSMEDELFNQLLQYVTETPVQNYTDSLLKKALELIAVNKELCKILFCKQKDSKVLDRILYIANKADIDQLINTSPINKTYLEYFIKYSVGGVFAVVQNWLEKDLAESPSEIIEIIQNINRFNHNFFN